MSVQSLISPVASPARTRAGAGSRAYWLAGLYYLLAAIAVTMWLWRDPASRIVALNPFDSDQSAWFLRYDATAVAHLRLPALMTTGMNAPRGVNLMWNTPMMLPGVVLAPLTLLAGPQVSLTVMMTAGFAGSALAMFATMRRRGASAAAAGAGGLVYGFSPALMGSALGHYDLQFAVLPPLIVDAALRLACQRPRAAVRGGAWLGLLVAAQIFITEELLFDSAVAIVIMLAAMAVSRPRAVRAGAAGLLAGGAAAAGVVTVIAGYPLWEQFSGPLRQHGSPFALDFYTNDLAGFVRPSSLLLVHTRSGAQFAAAFRGGLPEYLGYLGWPMIAVLALTAVTCWRLLPVRVTAVALAVLEAASLGGTLLAGGHEFSWVKLPWYWLQGLPLASSVIPDRFSIVADGAAAALFAFGLDRFGLTGPGPSGPGTSGSGASGSGTSGSGTSGSGARGDRAGARPWWPPGRRAVVTAITVAAIAALLPRPLPTATASPVPAGWTTTFSALRLPASAPVLVVPVPMSTFTEPLRWEADTGVPASMIGGYFMGPARAGRAATDGNGPTPGALFLNRLWAESAAVDGSAAAADRTAAADRAATTDRAAAAGGATVAAAQLRTELAAQHAAAVVAVTTPRSPLGEYLIRVLGPPAATAGQVLAWRLTPRR